MFYGILKRVFLSSALIATFSYGSCNDLARAYPSVISGCSGNKLLWRSGGSTIYDDGKRKSFNQALNSPDLEDMFRYSYPRGKSGYGRAPSVNNDPGRIRYEPLFFKMYGSSSSAVRRNLTSINWFGQRVRVTRINGVASQLKAVARDLAKIPNIRRYLRSIGGTFKWRRIAGTKRMSVHSFGAAIDINVKYSTYWRWSKGKYRYQNKIPLSIVKAFERHGFIWGGKWYHYDTMHFEYRPELLGKSGVSYRKAAMRHQKHKRVKNIAKKSIKDSRSTYIVERGDGLYRIAKNHNISKDKLMKMNNLSKDDILKIGQVLRIK